MGTTKVIVVEVIRRDCVKELSKVLVSKTFKYKRKEECCEYQVFITQIY